MVTQCCECRITCEDAHWEAPIILSDAGECVSHGYCPSCYEKAKHEIDDYYSNPNRVSTPPTD